MKTAISHVRSRAPLRIGISGGGTDLQQYYDIYNGATLNATIKKYAYAELTPSKDCFIAESIENKKILQINSSEIIKFEEIPNELILHFAIYKKLKKLFNKDYSLNCKLSTYCDAPIGSGLGSSSTLVVAILKAFDESLNLGLDDYQIAELAYEIERIDCNLAGGKQDHYSAAFGGFNYIEFKKNSVLVNPLRIKEWFKSELECSLILHGLGISRHSKDVINDQLNQCESNSKHFLNYLHELKNESLIMKDAFLKCDRSTIKKSLNRSWVIKSKTSKRVSNHLIESRIKIGFECGADAAKVSGAGGGGFILFMIQPSRAINLKNELSKLSQDTFFFSFEEDGATAWKVL